MRLVFLVRGFSPVEFEEAAAVVKVAKGLLIKSALRLLCCALHKRALQWQSERHESVLVPRDIHLSQVCLPGLYYFFLSTWSFATAALPRTRLPTENYKASWTPQKSLIPPAMMAKMGHREENSGFCFVGSISTYLLLTAVLWQILTAIKVKDRRRLSPSTHDSHCLKTGFALANMDSVF